MITRAMLEDEMSDLTEGYQSLLKKQEEVRSALERQLGGIAYAKSLLEKIDAQEAEAATQVDAVTTQ